MMRPNRVETCHIALVAPGDEEQKSIVLALTSSHSSCITEPLQWHSVKKIIESQEKK